jgi:hypothetical protein
MGYDPPEGWGWCFKDSGLGAMKPSSGLMMLRS